MKNNIIKLSIIALLLIVTLGLLGYTAMRLVYQTDYASLYLGKEATMEEVLKTDEEVTFYAWVRDPENSTQKETKNMLFEYQVNQAGTKTTLVDYKKVNDYEFEVEGENEISILIDSLKPNDNQIELPDFASRNIRGNMPKNSLGDYLYLNEDKTDLGAIMYSNEGNITQLTSGTNDNIGILRDLHYSFDINRTFWLNDDLILIETGLQVDAIKFRSECKSIFLGCSRDWIKTQGYNYSKYDKLFEDKDLAMTLIDEQGLVIMNVNTGKWIEVGLGHDAFLLSHYGNISN